MASKCTADKLKTMRLHWGGGLVGAVIPTFRCYNTIGRWSKASLKIIRKSYFPHLIISKYNIHMIGVVRPGSEVSLWNAYYSGVFKVWIEFWIASTMESTDRKKKTEMPSPCSLLKRSGNLEDKSMSFNSQERTNLLIFSSRWGWFDVTCKESIASGLIYLHC